MSVKATFSIALTLVGDGTAKTFSVDLRDLPANALNSMPSGSPSAIGTASLIDVDGTTELPAKFALNGHIVTVSVPEALVVPGPNFSRYTLNVFLFFDTN